MTNIYGVILSIICCSFKTPVMTELSLSKNYYFFNLKNRSEQAPLSRHTFVAVGIRNTVKKNLYLPSV